MVLRRTGTRREAEIPQSFFTARLSFKINNVQQSFFKLNRLGLSDTYYVFYRLLSTTHFRKLVYYLRTNATES